ncbi:potassium-transporting ATPase subunit KdpC [Pseudomonas segetis]
MLKQIRPALSVLVFMTLLTGAVYPLTVTAIAQLAFPVQANGSLVRDAQGEVRGSQLLAQGFAGAQWFQPRPSAGDYATVASAASNLAPSNPALVKRVAEDAKRLQVAGQGAVPMQLVTTSGSGLDPHLSPAAARYQVARIAAARNMPRASLDRLIDALLETPLIGPQVVNVLALNMALAENQDLSRAE